MQHWKPEVFAVTLIACLNICPMCIQEFFFTMWYLPVVSAEEIDRTEAVILT